MCSTRPSRRQSTRCGKPWGDSPPSCCDGVTGSGKTEVYLRVDRRGRARSASGAGAGAGDRSHARSWWIGSAARFDAPLAVLHSALNDQERLAHGARPTAATAPIVIGTRSAIFAPLAPPGPASSSTRSMIRPTSSRKGSAIPRATLRSRAASDSPMPVILGSATPSLESLTTRAGGRPSCALPMPDGRRRAAPAAHPRPAPACRDAGLRDADMLAIKRHLDAGGQVLCTSIAAATRRRSSARLRLDRTLPALRRAPDRAPARAPAALPPLRHPTAGPTQCPTCGETVQPLGQGTERIEETLAQLFPDMPLVRIDRDAVAAQAASSRPLDRHAAARRASSSARRC